MSRKLVLRLELIDEISSFSISDTSRVEIDAVGRCVGACEYDGAGVGPYEGTAVGPGVGPAVGRLESSDPVFHILPSSESYEYESYEYE